MNKKSKEYYKFKNEIDSLDTDLQKAYNEAKQQERKLDKSFFGAMAVLMVIYLLFDIIYTA